MSTAIVVRMSEARQVMMVIQDYLFMAVPICVLAAMVHREASHS
jgi:hypothetical protein